MPVEMGVARRGDKIPVYYLYHLHRGDPALHSPQCPHRIEHEGPLAQSTQSEPKSDGKQDSDDTGSLVVHTPLLEPRQIQPPRVPALTGMAALLEAVLRTSGLNAWHPGYFSHRSYYQARYRLMEACKKIRPFGATTLADVLFMPQLWDQAKREELESDWQCFLEQIHPTADHVPRGVIIGRLWYIAKKPEWTAPMIKLSEWKHPFWLDACPNLIADAPSEDWTWLVMLAVEVQPGSYKLRVIDGAAMRITPQWLPVFSGAHANLANDLVHQRVSFTTSLHTDPATSWAVPDFVASSRDGQPRRIFPRRE